MPMPESALIHFSLVLAVTAGMMGAAAVGWRIGRIMSPRPGNLRDLAKMLGRDHT